MAEEKNGTLRSAAWSELMPWLRLFRVFKLATGFRVLLLGAVAFTLTLGGWSVLGSVFFRASVTAPDGSERPVASSSLSQCPWAVANRLIPDRPEILGSALRRLTTSAAPAPAATSPRSDHPADATSSAMIQIPWRSNPLIFAWSTLTWPVIAALGARPTAGTLAFILFCGLWALVVWAFFGAAITRIVSVQLACEERLSWSAVISHTVRKWLAYFAAPLFPLIGIALTAIPIAILGLILRVGPGILLVAIIWPVLLIGGLIMALLLLGLLFGWPLMWATISTEGTDSFDALSRSYAYTFQRPLQYLWYVLVASVIGLLGWFLVSEFTSGVVWLVYWAASWGSGGERMQAIAAGSDALSGVGAAGGALVRFWVSTAKLFAAGFLFSYFWTTFTAIYYLLRHSVDATEMDEVFLEDDEPSLGLPPMAPVAPPPAGTAESGESAVPPEDAGPSDVAP